MTDYSHMSRSIRFILFRLMIVLHLIPSSHQLCLPALIIRSLLSSDCCCQVEGLVPAEMKEVFGPNVLQHTLVLLTCGDYLGGQNEEVISFYSTYFIH